MRRTILLATAVLLAAPAHAQTPSAPVASPVDPDRIAAANRLIDLMRFEETLDRIYLPLAPVFAQSVIGAMSNDPDGKQAISAIQARDKGHDQLVAILSQEFLTAMKRTYPALKKEAAADYAAAFTTDELNSIAAFYQTGAGAKALKLLPELQQKLAIAGRKLGETAGREAGQRGFERAAREILGVQPRPKA